MYPYFFIKLLSKFHSKIAYFFKQSEFQKKFILFVLLAIFTTGCSCQKDVCTGWERKIDDYDISKIVIFYSKEIQEEHALYLEDAKVYYDEEIENICLSYKTQAIVDLCEARKLTVDVVEGFLNRINNDPIIAFQTARKPFTEEDLNLTINFSSFFTRFVDPLYIGFVCMKDGIVYYYAGDLKDNLADWSHQRVEPFFKSQQFAHLKEQADMEYTDIYKEEENLQPHPFLFDKMIPAKRIENLKPLTNSILQ